MCACVCVFQGVFFLDFVIKKVNFEFILEVFYAKDGVRHKKKNDDAIYCSICIHITWLPEHSTLCMPYRVSIANHTTFSGWTLVDKTYSSQ